MTHSGRPMHPQSSTPELLQALWVRERFAPTTELRAVILHGDGPLYLPAGPGSGKTRVLLWRAVNLIAVRGIRPDDIFLSTFTEKAAPAQRGPSGIARRRKRAHKPAV